MSNSDLVGFGTGGNPEQLLPVGDMRTRYAKTEAEAWQSGYDKGRADASVRIAELEQHVLGLRKALAYKDERIAELEALLGE